MPSIHNMKAINIQAWIDEHREILKPPVDYGTVHFVGILPDESWTEYINNGRE